MRKLWLIGIATTLLATSLLWLFSSLSLKPLRLIRTWKAHKSPINSIAFFPDGQRLLSASWFDGTVRVWKNRRWHEDQRTFPPSSPLDSLSI
jgi:WD40 repeat protein